MPHNHASGRSVRPSGGNAHDRTPEAACDTPIGNQTTPRGVREATLTRQTPSLQHQHHPRAAAHQRPSVHPRAFHCTGCGQTFADPDMLVDHMEKADHGTWFECHHPECNWAYVTQHLLSNHNAQHHSGLSQPQQRPITPTRRATRSHTATDCDTQGAMLIQGSMDMPLPQSSRVSARQPNARVVQQQTSVTVTEASVMNNVNPQRETREVTQSYSTAAGDTPECQTVAYQTAFDQARCLALTALLVRSMGEKCAGRLRADLEMLSCVQTLVSDTLKAMKIPWTKPE
jgi:hypothetical protein